MATVSPKDSPTPAEIVQKENFDVISGSGVTVNGKERFSFLMPIGHVINISFLDSGKRVLFVNRQLLTKMDSDGAATNAAMLLCMKLTVVHCSLQ